MESAVPCCLHSSVVPSQQAWSPVQVQEFLQRRSGSCCRSPASACECAVATTGGPTTAQQACFRTFQGKQLAIEHEKGVCAPVRLFPPKLGPSFCPVSSPTPHRKRGFGSTTLEFKFKLQRALRHRGNDFTF